MHSLSKFRKPTKYDAAPFKSLWVFNHESGGNCVYVQMSENHLLPDWKRLGDMLEIAFLPFIENEAFLTECLNLYAQQYDKTFIKIVQIISSS